MKILTSPLFVRMATVLLAGVTAFVLGIVAVRLLRRRMVDRFAAGAFHSDG